MISEEIAAAKRLKQQRVLSGIIIVLLLSLLAVIVLYGASYFQQWSANRPTTTETAAPTSTTDETTEQTEASTPPPASDDKHSETPDDQALREDYLAAYAHYENDLKPKLGDIDIQQWEPARAEQLKQEENAAVSAFGNGNYAEAKTAIETLINTAEHTLKDSDAEYEQAMQQAEAAYENLDYPAARAAIDSALLHQSASEQALSLADKIEQIPDITRLTEAIRVANVENNPQKELALIDELLTLTPDNDNLKQRADDLRKQIADAQFNQAVSQAKQALAAQNTSEVKQALQRAKAIYPSHPDTAEITQALAQLESKQRLTQHLAMAEQAQKADNWSSVTQALTAALKETPADAKLKDRLNTAKRIVELQQTMTDLLASPYSLSSDALQAKANIALTQSENVVANSPTLKHSAQQLRSTLSAINTPVSVDVLSDGETAVSVRGVGQVGTVKAKTISLRPGKYTFEGKRAGYKSKLVDVTVPLDTDHFQVKVVADEQI